MLKRKITALLVSVCIVTTAFTSLSLVNAENTEFWTAANNDAYSNDFTGTEADGFTGTVGSWTAHRTVNKLSADTIEVSGKFTPADAAIPTFSHGFTFGFTQATTIGILGGGQEKVTAAQTAIFLMHPTAEGKATIISINADADFTEAAHFTEASIIAKDFDTTINHTFHSVKIGSDYYLAIDGIAIVKDSAKLNAAIDADGKTFFAMGSIHATAIKNVKVSEKAVVIPAEFTVDEKDARAVAITGDNDDGYDMTFNKHARARTTNKLDIINTSVSAKIDTEAGDAAWLYFAIGQDESPEFYLNDTAAKTLMYRIILNKTSDNVAKFCIYNGSDLYVQDIANFDETKEHTISFVEEDGKVYLKFDDTVIKSDAANIAPKLNDDGEAYIFLGGQDRINTFKNVVITVSEPPPPPAPKAWEAESIYSSAVGITGEDATNYNITFAGMSRAKTIKKYDISKATLSGVFNTSEQDSTWTYIAFSKNSTSKMLLSKTDASADTIEFIITHNKSWVGSDNVKRPGTAIVQIWDTATQAAKKIAEINDFDSSKELTYKVVKEGASYYLAIGNTVLNDDSAKLNGFVGAESFIYLGTNSGAGVANNVKLTVEGSGSVEAPKEAWYIAPSVKDKITVSGDNTSGYTMNFASKARIRSFEKMNFKNFKLSGVLNNEAEHSQWITLAFSTSEEASFLAKKDAADKNDTVEFIITYNKGDGAAIFQVWNPEREVADSITTLYDFDPSKNHTYTIVKEAGAYYLAIDGVILQQANAKLDKYVANGGYLYMGASSKATFTQVKATGLNSNPSSSDASVFAIMVIALAVISVVGTVTVLKLKKSKI